jgi:protein arginine kinase activator
MKCQICEQADATVHFKEIKNDEVKELHLCEKCAQEKGFHSVVQSDNMSLAAQFKWMAENIAPDAEGAPGQVVCPECGLRYSQFARTGRLGCASCYKAFHSQITPILRRVHGSTRHAGKAPGLEGKRRERREVLHRLHDDLEDAIHKEEFEKAAKIRDEIREIEKELAAEEEASR